MRTHENPAGRISSGSGGRQLKGWSASLLASAPPALHLVVLIVEQENLLDGQAEIFRYAVGQPQRGIVFPLFKEDDGLAADPDLLGQIELGNVMLCP